MLLGEPPPTSGDLHFNVLGFPVRVHPFFWIISLIFGMGGIGSKEKADPLETVLWVVAAFVSILVHELGHAMMQRRFGGHPWITLYSMGGLASCDDCDRSPRSQIIISFAGPLAGFLLALAVLLLVVGTGHQIEELVFSGDQLEPSVYETYQRWIEQYGARPPVLSVPFKTWIIEPFSSPAANSFVDTMLWINIWWGLLNLLPIYPLDGGRISREVFTLNGNPRTGIVRSLWLSVAVAVAVGVFGLMRGSFFMMIMFGYLAYQNYQTIQAYASPSRPQSW